jgi:hypothetical protein
MAMHCMGGRRFAMRRRLQRFRAGRKGRKHGRQNEDDCGTHLKERAEIPEHH